MKDEFLGAMIFSPPCWDFWYQFKKSLSSETIDISQVEIKRSYLFYFYCWQNMLGKHSLELSIIGLPTCKTLCQNFPCSRSQEEQLDSYWPPFVEVEWVLYTTLQNRRKEAETLAGRRAERKPTARGAHAPWSFPPTLWERVTASFPPNTTKRVKVPI